MERSNFENLRIYKLAEALADQVWDIVIEWNGFNRNTVGSQLVRAADSVGANIAEGVGRWGLQDQKRFMYIARASLNETKHLASSGFSSRTFNRRTDRPVEAGPR